jgi:hypothetical protein
VQVEAGQLRQWRPETAILADNSGGKIFLVLHRDPNFTNDTFWLVLRSEGGTKLWSETRIERWSEVIGGDG